MILSGFSRSKLIYIFILRDWIDLVNRLDEKIGFLYVELVMEKYRDMCKIFIH